MQLLLTMEVAAEDGLDGDVDQWNPMDYGPRSFSGRIIGRFFGKGGNSVHWKVNSGHGGRGDDSSVGRNDNDAGDVLIRVDSAILPAIHASKSCRWVLGVRTPQI